MIKEFFRRGELRWGKLGVNILLIANTFLWYYGTFITIKSIIMKFQLDYFSAVLIWGLNFGGAGFSALFGGVLVEWCERKARFVVLWILFGVFSSLTLWFSDLLFVSQGIIIINLTSLLLGISFGLGMPFCMGYFTRSTDVDMRAKFGGIILFFNYIGTFILFTLMISNDILVNSLILAILRFSTLSIFLFCDSLESDVEKKTFSYVSILKQKPFLFYYTPWIMFSLVNYMGMSIQLNVLEETLASQLILTENVLAGAFAVLGGFFSDVLGRKRMAIVGFVALGLGYAILGIFPGNLFCWYFYTFVDGIAWGILYVIFLMTIWGDLEPYGFSEKYYALGGLPYLLSSFLRIILGSYIADIVPAYAIFSFTALFLFLAVIPLMFAPETLPEKKIRERQLKQYVEKAKKIREKYG
jgi:MFS family permease